LIPALQALGEKHASYGVQAAHFDAVGAALLGALGKCAGSLWSSELETAWSRVYGLIASVMIEAMNRKRTIDHSLAPHTLQSAV
jgi:hemoglobin-like flavoprotein